jgi:hypothetical protein
MERSVALKCKLQARAIGLARVAPYGKLISLKTLVLSAIPACGATHLPGSNFNTGAIGMA